MSAKTRGYIEVPGTDVQIPYTQVEGFEPGPRLLVTGGVHGGEYPGIEAAIRFAASLRPEEIRGTVTVIHLTNPPAFYGKTQYVVPLDGKNLNREFPGRADGTPTERMAYAVFNMARSHDAWVDLHGGDIHEALVPFVIYSPLGDPAVAARSQAMAHAYGIETLVESASIQGGSYATATAHGIAAILAESGQVGQLDERSVARHLDGLARVLALLGISAAGAPASVPPASPVVYTQNLWVRAPMRGLQYPVVEVGEDVVEGQVGARIQNEWGEVLAELPVPASGRVLFRATSLAITEGDPLFAVIVR
ncbi:MAG: M14 family metallopeptidase [Clostridia bacterium]